MIGSVFLCGGGASHKTLLPFLQDFAKGKQCIAILQSKPLGSFYHKIYPVWEKVAAGRTFDFIFPKGGSFTKAQLSFLQEADAIFIGGGDTRRYHALYARGIMAETIRQRFHSGANVGGISAGALIQPAGCFIWGAKVKTKAGIAAACAPVGDPAYLKSTALLKTGRGIGTLQHLVVEVHSTEWGRLPRLFESLKILKESHGVAVDENTYLVLTPGKYLRVGGQGRVYCVEREQKSYRLTIYDRFSKIPWQSDLFLAAE